MDNLVNLLGSEAATYIEKETSGETSKLPEKIGMSGDAIIGPLIRSYFNVAMKGQEPIPEAVAKEAEMIMTTKHLDMTGTERIPTK